MGCGCNKKPKKPVLKKETPKKKGPITIIKRIWSGSSKGE